MKRDVRDIRKSIAQRKKDRELKGKKSVSTPVSYVQEEEKYGYLPFTQGEERQSANAQLLSAFVYKVIVAAILFFSVAILYRMEASFLQKPKEWVSGAVTEEFQFASVNKWYQDNFGEPLAFLPQVPSSNDVQPVSAQHALPVNGTIRESFQKNGQGVVIETPQQQEVKASNGGMVIKALNKSDTGKTVVIQHADGSKTYYGFLDEINVNAYEHVNNGATVGTTTPTSNGEQRFYFAIQKGDDFIDPFQVIQVHDQP